jgi:alkylation response protein AidB-like acyl-CoA dehydrogenase
VDFTFDEVQQDVRNLATDIFTNAVPLDRLKQVEATDDGIDRDLWIELASADLLGIALPEDIGGSGHGIMELGVLLQEMGRHVAPVPLISTIGLAALPIAAYGTPEQRKRLLVPVLDGASLLTGAFQESARTDPSQPETTATPDGSRWRLDGRKVAVPHAPLADRIVVNAQTPDGPALFLLEPSAPGVRMEATRSTHRELQANVTLEGAVVEGDDVLADPAVGEEALRYVHRHALACLCATAVGVFEEAVRITAGYISQREQFGRPIATFQGATLKAADAYIDTGAVRVTTWSALWRLAEGLSCDDELAIAKYWVADGGQRIAHACQHLHGGMGVDTDYPIHRYFLWAKQLELSFGGTTPQLLRIGASLAEG